MPALNNVCKPIIGVIHLPPLPGSKGYRKLPYPARLGKKWSFEEILDYAVEEARKYAEAGFDAVIVENYGDRPYTLKATPGQVAAMTAVVARVRKEAGIPVGVNVLRNSAYEALYIAYTTGASMVRVNNICEYRVSLEGVMEPAVHDLARAVSELDLFDRIRAGEFMILADIDVKHSWPVASRYEAPDVVADCLDRVGFLVNAIIVTGPATGAPPEPSYVEELASPARGRGYPVFIGSGIGFENIASYWRIADGFVIGSSVKLGGETENIVSVDRATRLVKLVRHYRETWPCH